MGDQRLNAIRQKMAEASVDAFLVSKPENWRYLSGFTGDSGVLVVTRQEAFIFTDSRYTEQAQEEAPRFTVVETSQDKDAVKETILGLSARKIAFEKEHVSYSVWEQLKERFPDQELLGVSGWVEDLRQKKTPEEIEYITRAQEIADNAFALITQSVKAGVREIDLALELEFTMRKMGSDGVAFPVITVSGVRSSLPHGQPSEKRLEPGDFVTFDFGARFRGYCSDMTRTFVVEPLDQRHREIYETVLRAQLTALEAVRPGIPAKEVDLAGRKVIEEAGYGQYFGHAIGHGVGLNVHEGPRVGKKGETILEPGMVITVEPGIYIPGFGGVRIEDLVLVTEDGKRILSSSPKELTVLKER